MDNKIPAPVVTTEPLLVRRLDARGNPGFEILAAGALCELIGEDDVPGTYILVDEHGDEIWRVLPVQFTPAP